MLNLLAVRRASRRARRSSRVVGPARTIVGFSPAPEGGPHGGGAGPGGVGRAPALCCTVETGAAGSEEAQQRAAARTGRKRPTGPPSSDAGPCASQPHAVSGDCAPAGGRAGPAAPRARGLAGSHGAGREDGVAPGHSADRAVELGGAHDGGGGYRGTGCTGIGGGGGPWAGLLPVGAPPGAARSRPRQAVRAPALQSRDAIVITGWQCGPVPGAGGSGARASDASSRQVRRRAAWMLAPGVSRSGRAARVPARRSRRSRRRRTPGRAPAPPPRPPRAPGGPAVRTPTAATLAPPGCPPRAG